MKRLINWLTTYIIDSMNLSEYFSIVNYAVDVILKDFTTFLVALVIACMCFGELENTIIFAVSFAFLRQYAGGIHSLSYIQCICTTTCMFCMSIEIIEYINSNILFVLAVISSGGIWLLSPIQTVNRRTSLLHRRRNQYIARKILIFYWICILLLGYAYWDIVNTIQISMVMIFILQLLERLVHKNKSKYYIPKQMELQSKVSISNIVLSMCIFVCYNAVQSACKFWNYEDDIPDDIQRKFDNM